MSSSTADALGLSRAILCNDGLVKKLEELEKNATMYHGLVLHVRKLLKAIYDLSRVSFIRAGRDLVVCGSVLPLFYFGWGSHFAGQVQR